MSLPTLPNIISSSDRPSIISLLFVPRRKSSYSVPFILAAYAVGIGLDDENANTDKAVILQINKIIDNFIFISFVSFHIYYFNHINLFSY